jgi:uncharacterized membrane protein
LRGRWGTERIEAFSDGVFAIAITLLVLDLAIPDSEISDLWHGIAHLWPGYLGYVTSFLTIGGIWLGHHGIFSRLRYANNTVMRLNLLLLMAVAFLPFPTRLMAQALRSKDAERAAVVFYGLSLFVIRGLISAMWGAVRRDRELLKPEVTNRDVTGISLAAAPSVAVFIGSIVLAIFVPRVAAFSYLVIAVVVVLGAHSDEVPDRTPPAQVSGR